MLQGFFKKKLPYRVSGISWILVGLQFTALAYITFSAPLVCISLMGLFAELGAIMLIMSGVFQLSWTSFSVFPEPRPDGKLETEGIYAWIRHPMYAGILLITFLLVLDYPSINRVLSALILTIVLLIKIRHEEKWLLDRYPQFTDWKKSSDRLIPFVW
jgi:protein-S-isoprenylcysteine O-methyltransferase Ste14